MIDMCNCFKLVKHRSRQELISQLGANGRYSQAPIRPVLKENAIRKVIPVAIIFAVFAWTTPASKVPLAHAAKTLVRRANETVTPDTPQPLLSEKNMETPSFDASKKLENPDVIENQDFDWQTQRRGGPSVLPSGAARLALVNDWIGYNRTNAQEETPHRITRMMRPCLRLHVAGDEMTPKALHYSGNRQSNLSAGGIRWDLAPV
jgi:hypothetical protein